MNIRIPLAQQYYNKNQANQYEDQKCVKLSYLWQTQQNQNNEQVKQYEFNKQRSRYTLKQITDKYGFYWDENGKLSKIKEKKKNSLNHTKNKNQPKILNDQVKKQLIVYLGHENQMQYNYKQQIKQIDEKINRIISKYPKRNQYINIKNEQFFCNCKDKYNNLYQHNLEDKNELILPYFGQMTSYKQKQLPKRCKSQIKLKNKNEKLFKKQNHNNFPICLINTQQNKENKINSNFNFKYILPAKSTQKKHKNNFDTAKQQQIINKIDLITQKIIQSEKQKQQLNINYKKFSLRTQPNYVYDNNQLSIASIQKNQLKQGQKQNFKQTKENFLKKDKSKSKYNLYFNIEDSFAQQKSPILHQTNSTQSLIKKIVKQIELDQQLRSIKIWFENNNDPHKWGILADKFALEGVIFSYNELYEKFNCLLCQHNPFFSGKNDQYNYEQLIQTYWQSEKHWLQKLENKFTIKQLQKENFSQKQLDIQKKGFIRIEDFVRYTNMRTKNFYRTRDFALIFGRFGGKGKKQIHFTRILQVLLQ